LYHVLKESWSLLEEHQEEFARYVFARLFLAHPEARELFPVAMETQQAQLVSAIVTTIHLYNDADAVDFYLRALGREHRKYRLTEPHLAALSWAMIDGARRFGGERWSSLHERAWINALRLAANTIRASTYDHAAPPCWDAEVVAHQRIGSDLALLTVRPRAPLPFLPGQHLPVETPVQPRLWREFSIANAPRADNTIDLHVRAVPGGLVSGALVRRTQVGDRLRLAEPSGDLLLDRRSTRDIVCVADGTGFAPIKALLEEVVRYNRTRWVHLIFGGHTRDDLYDLAALRQLAARHPWLSLIPVVAADPGFRAEHGTMAEVVERLGPWPDHDCFIAGPATPVYDTLRAFDRLRVPVDRVRYCAFPEAPSFGAALPGARPPADALSPVVVDGAVVEPVGSGVSGGPVPAGSV
jgi:NAD(P)H-flavin reductase/hemoglobin-like flavoprotein